MSTELRTFDELDLQEQLEAIVAVSLEPISIAQACAIVGMDLEHLSAEERGLIGRIFAGSYFKPVDQGGERKFTLAANRKNVLRETVSLSTADQKVAEYYKSKIRRR